MASPTQAELLYEEMMGGSNQGDASSQTTPIAQPQAQESVQEAPSNAETLYDSMISATPQSTAPNVMDYESTSQGESLPALTRMKLAFADKDGAVNELKKQFKYVQELEDGKLAYGNDPRAMLPVDPEGFANDIVGDLADLSNEAIVIASQIAGSALGSVAGPAGTVLGGGAGAGVGEGINKLIGKGLGVNQQNAQEMGTDIAIETGFGAGGEVLGQALKGAGRYLIKPQLTKLIDKSIEASANPSKTAQVLSRVFGVTAAIDEKDVTEASLYGFNKVLSPKYSNEQHLGSIIKDFADGVIEHNTSVGKAVEAGDNWALSKFGAKKVPLQQAGNKLLNSLADEKVSLIDPVTKTINKKAFTNPQDYKAVHNFMESFFSKNPKTGELIPRNLEFKQALALKKKAAPFLKSYFKSDAVNRDAQRAIAEFLSGVNDEMARTTIPAGVSNITEEVIDHNPYLRANKVFSSWKEDLSTLRKSGLDIEDVTELKGMIRGNSIINAKLESFAKNLQNKTSSAKEAFAQIADKIPKKYEGAGIRGGLGTVYDELRKFNAAQGFSKANPNMLRLGSIATMAGLGFLVDRNTPSGFATGTALGIGLGTPAGAKFLLKGGESLKFGAQALLKEGVKDSVKALSHSERIGVATLSRLLSAHQKNQRNKK